MEQERTKPPHKMTTRTEERAETETFADLIGFASDQVREIMIRSTVVLAVHQNFPW